MQPKNWALSITKWMNRGYLVGTTPTVSYRFFRNFTVFFGHPLKICMWFGYNLQILSKLHCFFGHPLKICMWFGYNLQIFLLLFLQVELSHFSGIIYNKVNGQGIPCGRNSSYSFIPILLKLHWCFGYGLKICMWFGYNPQIIFVTYSQVELSHFFRIFYKKMNGQGIHCGRNSSYSFLPILSKLHWCFG